MPYVVHIYAVCEVGEKPERDGEPERTLGPFDTLDEAVHALLRDDVWRDADPENGTSFLFWPFVLDEEGRDVSDEAFRRIPLLMEMDDIEPFLSGDYSERRFGDDLLPPWVPDDVARRITHGAEGMVDWDNEDARAWAKGPDSYYGTPRRVR